MWLPGRAAVLLLFVLLTAGCGYHFAGTTPLILPEGVRTLTISRVNNPTILPWIGPELRNSVWDEISRRSEAVLKDSGGAEATLEMDIVRYSASTLLEGRSEQTVKSQVVLVVDGRLVRRGGGVVWSSGPVTVNETFVSEGQEREAAELAVQKVARRIVDRLDRSF
ncbi:MAG: LPS assembly lipoprotein LptE [Desulfovibrionales bacterium]